jgi:hypothetical protein
VPVEPVAAVAEAVPFVDVPPLPSAFPLEVVAVFVTGAPVPVSVAVVPVDVGWIVSVDPVVVSAGFRLHAAQKRRMAMMVMTSRMRMDDPPHACGAIVAPGWRATLMNAIRGRQPAVTTA